MTEGFSGFPAIRKLVQQANPVLLPKFRSTLLRQRIPSGLFAEFAKKDCQDVSISANSVRRLCRSPQTGANSIETKGDGQCESW